MMPLAAGHVFDVPLMIDSDKAAVIAAAFGPRLLGMPVIVLGEDGEAHPAAHRSMGVADRGIERALTRANVAGFPLHDGVGIIEVAGTLVHKGAFLGQSSGQTSYQGLQAQIARAAAMPEVRGVVLEVDSFGGQVNGAFETAAAIRRLSAEKPTLAILTDHALSAGYLLASQARQIVMPKAGRAGSIGVVTMHVNRRKQMEQEGLEVTVIASGAHKAEVQGLSPLSDERRAALQASVDRAREDFAEAVGAGRGTRLTKEAALATEARIEEGEAAVRAGLVDAIGDPVEAFAEFARVLARS